MSTRRSSKQGGPFPWRVHPIWRGIGCMLLITAPIIAYGLADLVLAQVVLPSAGLWARSLTVPGLGEVDHVLARAAITLALMVAVFLVFYIFGAFIYSRMGGLRDEEVAKFTERKPYDR